DYVRSIFVWETTKPLVMLIKLQLRSYGTKRRSGKGGLYWNHISLGSKADLTGPEYLFTSPGQPSPLRQSITFPETRLKERQKKESNPGLRLAQK
ncbi:MAG: hypothetical protein MUO52_01495, partial [Desulfobacterales bacterium]|nr:hypothetical protein [Desulfobacterales bacterium]